MRRLLLFLLLSLPVFAQTSTTTQTQTAGGGVSTAAGVVALFTSCSGTQYLGADGACHNAGGSGTVTSVGLNLNGGTPCGALAVTGSPVSTSGSLNINFTGVTGDILTFNGSNCPIDSSVLLSSLITTAAAQAAFSGIGACTNQAVRVLNANGAPTCVTITSAYVDSSIAASANYQTTATAQAAYSGIGSCSNKAVTADNANAAPTCTTLTSAYVDNSIALTGADINTSNQVTGGSHITNASIPNSGLVNAATTPNGITCTLGSACTIPLSANNAQTGTYQVLAADFSSYKEITIASGTFTITLVASGSQPAAGQYIRILNYGSGVITIARSGQNINGGTTSLTMPAATNAPSFASVDSDGTNYFGIVLSSNAQFLLNKTWVAPGNLGSTTPGTVTATTYSTGTNCSSSASPAVCAAAAAGSVALPTGTNPTLQVNTSAVTANSQIMLTVDESLGTKLSVTCNTTLSTLVNPVVTARSGGSSFTFTIGAVIASNPACVSYTIVN